MFNLEISVYNYAIMNGNKIVREWDNIYFVQIYKEIEKFVF